MTVLRRKRPPRVALLIESSRAYGRGLLAGIARYIRAHGPWSVYYQECKLGDLPAWLVEWEGDGIIARVENKRMAEALRQKGLPAVDVRGLLPDLGLPLVDTDNEAVVRMALEHLLDCGLRQLAFCGFAGADYSDSRCRSLIEQARQAGVRCHVYEPDHPVFQPDADHASGTFEYEQQGLIYEKDLEAWLKNLPKPIGLLACNDIRGQQVLNAARHIQVQVPEEIAVLGVDNDTILCELSDPPLSSVEPDMVRVGYEAAALLERLMQGRKPPRQPLRFPPVRVVRRRSTDMLALDDRAVAAGLRFLRENAFEPISVEEIARAAGLSRRVFERRFRQAVGRTPKAELIRLRLERAKALLLHTDLPLPVIAEKCGFKHTEYFHALFREKTGTTPARFRAEAQA